MFYACVVHNWFRHRMFFLPFCFSAVIMMVSVSELVDESKAVTSLLQFSAFTFLNFRDLWFLSFPSQSFLPVWAVPQVHFCFVQKHPYKCCRWAVHGDILHCNSHVKNVSPNKVFFISFFSRTQILHFSRFYCSCHLFPMPSFHTWLAIPEYTIFRLNALWCQALLCVLPRVGQDLECLDLVQYGRNWFKNVSFCNFWHYEL